MTSSFWPHSRVLKGPGSASSIIARWPSNLGPYASSVKLGRALRGHLQDSDNLRRALRGAIDISRRLLTRIQRVTRERYAG